MTQWKHILCLLPLAAASAMAQSNLPSPNGPRTFPGFHPVQPNGAATPGQQGLGAARPSGSLFQPAPAANATAPATGGWKVISPNATPGPGAAPATQPASSFAAAASAASMRAIPEPQPATVSFGGGRLTVNANNSTLEQILTDAAQKSGMVIEGAVPDQRVFGSFGPAPAATVLAELLDGTGTNYLIVGGGRGSAPRTLVLSAANEVPAIAGPQTAAAAQPMQPAGDDDDDDDVPPPPQQQPVPFRPNPAAENNGNGANPAQNGVRTPQQILEEMQKRRAASQNGSDENN